MLCVSSGKLARFDYVLLLVSVLTVLVQYTHGATFDHERWKRQSCSANQFQCDSGQCIGQFQICDGSPDCEDGSDETSKTCVKIVCPSYAYPCAYGACVNSDAKCNKRKDCADGSDEKGCSGSTADCKTNQFQCKTGTCIDVFLLCDGTKDCGDGSDEIASVCSRFMCPSYAFRCDYGACIDKVGECNGIQQCADGSDEKPEKCGTISTPPSPPTTKPKPSGGCTLPSQPENGQYKLGGCNPPCQPVPGQPVNTAFLTYTCKSDFVLSGSNILLCDGTWSAAFPTCSRATCPALVIPSRDIECHLNEKTVECDKPMAPGTKAMVKCDASYLNAEELSDFDIVCQSNGKWSREVTPCIPRCGEANQDGVPYISHGVKSKFGEYPWHAGIYRPIDGILKQVCEGSIISETVIITAAHCFWDDGTSQKIDFKQDKVVVGKYYLHWNNKTKHFQNPEIDHVVLHKRFKGHGRYFENDIALVALKGVIRMSQAVRPICVDYDKKYINHFTPGTKGIVIGWGVTGTMKKSDTLHTATLPYVDPRD